MTKPCSRCREVKPLEMFAPDRRHSTGRQALCKPCKAANERERRKRNPEHLRRLDRERYKRNPRAHKDRDLKLKYGIDHDELDRMLNNQRWRCAICEEEHREPRGLVIDHRHADGLIRGLLCQRCNRGIGLLHDDWAVLERAAAYVQFWSGAFRHDVDPSVYPALVKLA